MGAAGQQPFEQVVAEHGDVVWRVCRALLGPVDADDAWSATFLSALGAYDRLRPDSDVRAWLVTIAHRRAVDVLRSAARAPVPVGAAPTGAAPVGAAPTGARPGRADAGRRAVPGARALAVDAPDLLGPAERAPELWAALGRLTERQRGAVALHHLAGLPHAQVASVLGGSESAARRACADGIAALRRDLGGSRP